MAPALARLGDAVVIGGASVAATALLGSDPSGADRSDAVRTMASILVFLLAAELAGLYSTGRGTPLARDLLRVAGAWTETVGLLLVAAFVLGIDHRLSRPVTLGWALLAPLGMGGGRVLTRGLLGWVRSRGGNQTSVAIVGVTDVGEMLARRILASPWLGLHLAGFFDDRAPERLPDLPHGRTLLRGSFEDVLEEARCGRLDAVYVALPLRAEPRIQELLRSLADSTVSVHLVPDFFVFDLLHGRWSSVGDLPVVSIFESPFYGIDGAVKRLEDLVLGTAALLIAAPLMLVVAALIKLTSAGPVLFHQRRYGLNGEVIEVLKFRTMRTMDDGARVAQATRDDPRITPIGRFLRRSSIDELPQLLQVVAGTMSLVGPRPHAIAHNEEYRRRIRRYMLRHKVKPGLTGWAQVNGWRGETDTLEKMEKRVEHDLEYIRRWGLMLDLWIVVLTVFGRAVRKNAY